MKNTLSLMLFIITTSLYSQYSIHGKISDKNTSLPGASILIQNTQNGTTSDIEGFYNLHNIQNDSITLVISYSGYQTKYIPVYFDSNDKEINITLEETVFEIDEVILSTPFNKLQSENVVKVSYKSLASMQRKGIISLMDGVTQISGVSQMSTGSGISKPVIRGLSGNRVLVYNQGVRLENFQFGDKHGIGINESGIESVEVIKGPASLLYGSDAIGGVLYLIPEKFAKPNETHYNIHSQYASNSLGFNNTIGIKASGEKWQFLTRISNTLHADYQIPSKDRVTNSRYNDKDLKLGIGYKKEKFSTDIRYNYNQAQNGVPKNIGIQETDYKVSGLYQNLDNHVLSAKNSIKFQRTSLISNLGYTSHKRVLYSNTFQKIGMQLNTFNYDIKWHAPKWKSLESIIGIQGMSQTNNNFADEILLPNAKISNFGIFGTSLYKFDKIAIQGGLRYDTRHIVTEDVSTGNSADYRDGFDKTLTSFTGSLGLKSEISNTVNIRLNMAGGFRAPNLSELASKGQHAGRIEVGNPNIENEKNWQTDFAFEYKNTHIEFFTNAFYNAINNYIYLKPTGDIQDEMPIYQYQQDNAFLYGGEIGFHLHPHPWDWLHLESSFEMVNGQKEDKTYLPLIPANQWKNQIRLTNNSAYKHLSKYYINIGINHNFKTNHVSEFESTQDAYTLLNSGVGSELQFSKLAININLSVHNILNTTYISHLSLLRDFNIPNKGRNIIFGVNFTF